MRLPLAVILITASATSLFSADPAPQTAPAPAHLRPRIAQLAAPFIDGQWVQGMVIGVVEKDRPPSIYGFGRVSSDPAAPAPDGDTIYEIASVTKTFTALLLADMVQRNQLALDDPLDKFLPPGTTLPQTDQPLTLLRLATHHSGLPRMPANFAPRDPRNPYADYSLEQLYAFLGSCKPHPTATFEYSNYGFALLGQALSKRGGQSYEELVVGRICKPLGMPSTKITLSDPDKKRLAPPFDADGEPSRNWDLPTFAGGGALRSTASDMLRYVQAQLGLPLPAPAGDDLEVLRKAIAFTQSPHDSAGGQTRIGLAWLITPDGRHFHNGQTGGYHSFVAYDLKAGVGVVLLCNTATMRLDALGGQVLRLLQGQKTTVPVLPKPIEIPPALLDKYAGKYKLPDDSPLQVRRDGPRLIVQSRGLPNRRIYPRSNTEFFGKAVDATGTFEVDDSGAVTALTIKQDGRTLRATRVNEQNPK